MTTKQVGEERVLLGLQATFPVLLYQIASYFKALFSVSMKILSFPQKLYFLNLLYQSCWEWSQGWNQGRLQSMLSTCSIADQLQLFIVRSIIHQKFIFHVLCDKVGVIFVFLYCSAIDLVQFTEITIIYVLIHNFVLKQVTYTCLSLKDFLYFPTGLFLYQIVFLIIVIFGKAQNLIV